MSAVLELSAASAAYGSIEVCHGIDLALHSGHVTIVTGPNGAGKTTLVRRISGHVSGSGRLLLRGQDIDRLARYARARAGVLVVPEGRGLLPDLTVGENLQLAALLAPTPVRQERLAHAADRYPVVAERKAAIAGSLSGGEQQMLALARTLIIRPPVLILDEPSQSLAPRIVNEIAIVVEDLRSQGSAVLLVEQHLSLAKRVGDSVIVMVGGQVVLRGDGTDLLDEERLAETYLG